MMGGFNRVQEQNPDLKLTILFKRNLVCLGAL